jgi:hypothetical protein
MLVRHRRAASLTALTAWLAGSGCTALREIPRSEYSHLSEQKTVRLLTTDSLEYEFDFARISGDTLTGFRRQDVEGPAAEYATMSLPFSQIQRLSTRQVDWTRTGLVGGLGALIVAAAGLAAKNNGALGGGNQTGGPPGGRIP